MTIENDQQRLERLTPPLNDLTYTDTSLEAIIEAYRLDLFDLVDLLSLVRSAEADLAGAVNRLGFEAPAPSSKQPRLPEAMVSIIQPALKRFLLNKRETLDQLCLEARLHDKSRRLFCRIVVYYHGRVKRSLRILVNATHSPLPTKLPNSFHPNSRSVRDPVERLRMARNANHVAKLLSGSSGKGAKGLQLRTVVHRFDLNIDDALKVVGRDRMGRKIGG